jgi:Flp pilus assembly protein TadG
MMMIARTMQQLRGTARRRRVTGAERGAALIEFTLVFPILIALLLGVVEFSQAFAVSRKLSYAAATVSDLVAQMPRVTDADLADIANVADTLLAPYSAAQLGLVITSVQADNDNNTTVGWSWSHGSGASAHADNTAFTLPAGLTDPNTSVIAAETTYQFTPTIGLYLTGVITLTGQAYFRPRAVQVVAKTD